MCREHESNDCEYSDDDILYTTYNVSPIIIFSPTCFQLRFPRPSFKGWLHILLFLAFLSIMVTSITWIMWSQFSSSKAAQSERESKEATYAYAVNGGFMIMAVIGLYLDSFGQCRAYYKKLSLLNQELIVFPYDVDQDVDYCYKPAGLVFSPASLAISTPCTTANGSESMDDTTISFSFKNDGFTLEKQISEDPKDSHLEATSHRNQWPVMTAPYVMPNGSLTEQPTVHHSISLPADLQNILVLRETYV